MAACGLASRRACEEIIASGRVEVDGEIVVTPGTLVDPDSQDIRCDGSRIKTRRLLYYLLNKPKGVICSAKSAPDKPRAIDYVPPEAEGERLFTIGRLDVASEGAIIMTNDGDLAHKVSHPRFEVEKTYRVEVEGVPETSTLARMRKGVWLSEGRTGPVRVELLKSARDKSVLEMRIKEGRQREVRRICARFGHEVRRLVRISVGPVELGRLPRGHVRVLTPAEIDALRDTTDVVIRLGSPRASAASRTKGGARRRGQRPDVAGSQRKPATRKKSTRKKPAPKAPASKSPAGKQPAGRKPAGRKPVGKKPAGRKPAGRKPAGKKPAGRKPAGKKPAGKRPAARKPAPKRSGGKPGKSRGRSR